MMTLSTPYAIILGSMEDIEWSSIELRKKLQKNKGFKQTRNAFYASMARLENMGFVKGTMVKENVRGHTVEIKTYKIEGHGIKAFREWQKCVLPFASKPIFSH